jgi:hypothetical protein
MAGKIRAFIDDRLCAQPALFHDEFFAGIRELSTRRSTSPNSMDRPPP